jgi:hypothetical protein
MTKIPDVTVNRINVGKIIREYTTDAKRVIPRITKLASPFGRGPLRLARIMQCLFEYSGAFSVLNYPTDSCMRTLIAMKAIEDEILELGKKTKFINTEVEDMFVSFITAWLLTLNRTTILCSVLGRNDLSVPRILESITNISTSAFAAMEKRRWALTADITGGTRGGPVIEHVDMLPVRPESGSEGGNDEDPSVHSDLEPSAEGDIDGNSNNEHQDDDDDSERADEAATEPVEEEPSIETQATLAAVDKAKSVIGVPVVTEASVTSVINAFKAVKNQGLGTTGTSTVDSTSTAAAVVAPKQTPNIKRERSSTKTKTALSPAMSIMQKFSGKSAGNKSNK